MNWVDAVSQLEQAGQAYVLVTVLGVRGSSPRDCGTKMVVSAQQLFGTIGGGHLENKSVAIARQMLQDCDGDKQHVEHFSLSASLGQCCGGSVTVLFEHFSENAINIMLFGAGHVGQALTMILQELPCQLSWVDAREAQHSIDLKHALGSQKIEFRDRYGLNVVPIVNDNPAEEVLNMPSGSYYIVMTHNHPMDYAIVESILKRQDARYIGLIGSNTKWKRFQMRLNHHGYTPDYYQNVRCPVGLSNVSGKRPMEVAVSIAAEIICEYQKNEPTCTTQRGINWRDLKPVTQLDME